MKFAKLFVALSVIALTSMLVPSAFACCASCSCPDPCDDECCPCPPPCTPGFTPGFWKHNIAVALEYSDGAFSAFSGGPLDGEKCSVDLLNTLAGIVGVSLEEAYEVMSTGGGGAIAQARIDMANAFNAAAGYGPFA